MKHPIGQLQMNTESSLMLFKTLMTLTPFLFTKAMHLLNPTLSTVLSKTPWSKSTLTFIIIILVAAILSWLSPFSSSFLRMVVNHLHCLTNKKIYVRVCCDPNLLMGHCPLLFPPPHQHIPILLILWISKANGKKNKDMLIIVEDTFKSK